jgi:hypothetical protein
MVHGDLPQWSWILSRARHRASRLPVVAVWKIRDLPAAAHARSDRIWQAQGTLDLMRMLQGRNASMLDGVSPAEHAEGPMRRVTVWCLMAASVLSTAGCSTAETTPSATVTTLQPTWPQHLKLEWSVTDRPGGRRIDGVVYNDFGLPAADVQILAQALDASGAVIGQRIVYLPDWIPPRNRSFFRVDGLPPASSYRVSVWNFRFRDPQAS